MKINRTNFWCQNNYFWKVLISHIIPKPLKKHLHYELFSFNLNVEYIQLYNFRLWNCLWTRNPCRLVFPKVFLFQMLGETSTFTLPGKVPLLQRCQDDVLGSNMNTDVSPYILKFKFFFKNACSTMTALVQVGLF